MRRADAPVELLLSDEADVFPRDHIERSELIDSTIGEGSPFQGSFGYYAHCVDETTSRGRSWSTGWYLATFSNSTWRPR